MNELAVKGKQEFMGKEIPIIYGGFGNEQKVVLARDVAEIHGTELKTINQNINRNIKRFRENVDIIDLKTQSLPVTELEQLGFTKQSVANSKKHLPSFRAWICKTN